MNEISWGLSGVVVSLAGVIGYLALHIRDLNKSNDEARKEQVKQAEMHSKEKDKIYSLWMANESSIRNECKQELKVLLDKDQDLLLKVTMTLKSLLGDREIENDT